MLITFFFKCITIRLCVSVSIVNQIVRKVFPLYVYQNFHQLKFLVDFVSSVEYTLVS